MVETCLKCSDRSSGSKFQKIAHGTDETPFMPDSAGTDTLGSRIVRAKRLFHLSSLPLLNKLFDSFSLKRIFYILPCAARQDKQHGRETLLSPQPFGDGLLAGL